MLDTSVASLSTLAPPQPRAVPPSERLSRRPSFFLKHDKMTESLLRAASRTSEECLHPALRLSRTHLLNMLAIVSAVLSQHTWSTLNQVCTSNTKQNTQNHPSTSRLTRASDQRTQSKRTSLLFTAPHSSNACSMKRKPLCMTRASDNKKALGKCSEHTILATAGRAHETAYRGRSHGFGCALQHTHTGNLSGLHKSYQWGGTGIPVIPVPIPVPPKPPEKSRQTDAQCALAQHEFRANTFEGYRKITHTGTKLTGTMSRTGPKKWTDGQTNKEAEGPGAGGLFLLGV